jgi:hypothetical protein
MATYNFKKEAELYIVHGSPAVTTRLDVTEDISFSQTFTDKTYSKKTLHAQHKLHASSNIKKANPASFDFTIPALTQDSLDTIFNLLVDFKTGTYTLDTFDLYIKLPNDVYKLEKCVITNGTFIIEKLQNLKLGIQGQASKLTNDSTITIPGLAGATRGTRTEQKVDYLYVKVDSTDLIQGLYKVGIELQNDIKWTPYQTVNDALLVTNAATSMYPSNFTLEKRILSGSIGQYVTSDFNNDVQTWKTDVPLIIKAGESATQGFRFDATNCSFTNRSGVEDVFTQTYDWKMNDNTTDLGSKLTYIHT